MHRDVSGDATDRGRILGQPLGVRRHQHLNIDPELWQTPRELQRALDATTTSRRVVEGDQEDAETVGHRAKGTGGHDNRTDVVSSQAKTHDPPIRS